MAKQNHISLPANNVEVIHHQVHFEHRIFPSVFRCISVYFSRLVACRLLTGSLCTRYPKCLLSLLSLVRSILYLTVVHDIVHTHEQFFTVSLV